MHKKYPYLQDSYVYYTDKERYKRLLLKDIEQQVNQKQYVKITLLDGEENPIKAIEGEISSGSISKVADSPVRRTANLSCAVDAHSYSVEDGKADFAINKKVFIEIGVKNETPHYPEYPIFWFPEGVFFIASFSINSSSSSALNLSISLKDKMAMLNGDVGGTLPATVIFDSMDTQLPSGEYIEKKVLIYNIIKELVNHYGGESLNRIVIEGVPLRIRRIMKWVGDTPLYLYVNSNDPVVVGSGSAESYIYSTVKQDSDEYLVNTFSKGDDVGYIMDDFVITGELTGAPGESITSILDKIKNILGNYEYFYDVFGTFHFREIKNYYVTTQARTLLDEMAENDYLVETNNERSIFTFDDTNLLTSINITPQYENIKNDYIVEGHTESDSGVSYNVRYHLAIDKKPRSIGIDNRNEIYKLVDYDNDIAILQTVVNQLQNQLVILDNELEQLTFSINRNNNLINQYGEEYGNLDQQLFDILQDKIIVNDNIVHLTKEDLENGEYASILDEYGYSSILMYVYSNNWEDKRKITDNNDKNVIQQFLADYYKFQQDYIKDQIVMGIEQYNRKNSLLEKFNNILEELTDNYDINITRQQLIEDLESYRTELEILISEIDIVNNQGYEDEDTYVTTGTVYDKFVEIVDQMIADYNTINQQNNLLYGHEISDAVDGTQIYQEDGQNYYKYSTYTDDEQIESLYFQKYQTYLSDNGKIATINQNITNIQEQGYDDINIGLDTLVENNHKIFEKITNNNLGKKYYGAYPSSNDNFLINDYNYSQSRMNEYNTNKSDNMETLDNLTNTDVPATLIFYNHPRNGAITAAYVANVITLPDVGNFNLIYRETPIDSNNSTLDNFYYWSGTVYKTLTPLAVYTSASPEYQYYATDWRTKLYLDGLRGVINGTDKGYYYEELAAFWPQVYDLEHQCFYGQQDDDTIQFKTLCAGTYYLDFLDSLSTSLGEGSVDNIGRRTDMVVNDEINCLFQPEIPNIILLPTTLSIMGNETYNALEKEKSLYELRKEAQDNYYPGTQVDDEIYSNLLTGGYRNAAFDQIKYELYLHTRYQKSISMTSIPVFYLEPNSRVTIDDPVSNTYGDFIVQSINITLGPGANMSITCNETAERF